MVVMEPEKLSGDVERLRVRQMLKKGGKTPVFKTVVRTDDTVAASSALAASAVVTARLFKATAESLADTDRIAAVRAVADAYEQASVHWGDESHVGITPGEADALVESHASCLPTPAGSAPWPESFAHAPIREMMEASARVAALCTSFATAHRAMPNVENDLGEEIAHAAAATHEAYARLDDEVLRLDQVPEFGAAARLVNRRAKQLAAWARHDAHGEVFKSVEYIATRASLLGAMAEFNYLYLGTPLVPGSHCGVAHDGSLCGEAHARLAEALTCSARSETRVTNTPLRARRHAVRATGCGDYGDPLDPLGAMGWHTTTDQDLTLREWVTDAMHSGEALYDVIGGFSMGLDGSYTYHVPADALASADWLVLRAHTTVPADDDAEAVGRAASISASRRLRYDAGTYDAPHFRPTEDAFQTGLDLGVVLCGRGEAQEGADVLHVDATTAPTTLGLSLSGTLAHVLDARTAVGCMFSADEITSAADGNSAFLSDEVGGCPKAIEAAPVVPVVPVAPVAPVDAPVEERPAFEATHKALAAAIGVTLRESAVAFDDLASYVSERSLPSMELFEALHHKGERAVDVAATMLGWPELPPRPPSPELPVLDSIEELGEELAAGASGASDISEEFEELLQGSNALEPTAAAC